jgi:hypothetical protein
MQARGFDLGALSGARPASGAVFRVVLRCAGCSASESVYTTRTGLAGWTRRLYECGSCATKQRAAAPLIQFEKAAA